jgi:hypothetical protein
MRRRAYCSEEEGMIEKRECLERGHDWEEGLLGKDIIGIRVWWGGGHD